MRASAATSCRSGWTAIRSAGPTWAARARTGSARRRSPSATTCSRTSATAPTITPAIWRSAPSAAAGVNVTYKILFNDAVAMTGGQRNDGGLTVPIIARQVAAEGAKKIVVVTDEPWKYPREHRLAAGRHDPSSRRADGGADRARRCAGPHGADLRPDLRGREAPPPQARPVPRSRQARRHQRAGLRRLRRLRRAVELRVGAAAGNRMGPQAHHRPVELQQGLSPA